MPNLNVTGIPVLDGRWAYTIQGLMQWTNPVLLGFDPNGALEVGWAFGGVANAAGGEFKSFPDFTPIPLTVVNLEPFIPVPLFPEGDGVRAHQQGPLPGHLPGSQTLPPVSGYLPYAESGRIDFMPDDTLEDSDGTLEGSIWFTVAGRFIYPLRVSGRFKFNRNNVLPELDPPGNVPPVGGMSFIFNSDNPPPKPATHFNWDYSFIMVSSDEAQLITAGRYPRPITGSGTMKRVDWDSIRRA